MSYQVYITRAAFWAENEGSEIAAREWLELMQADADITQDEARGPYFGVLDRSQKNAESWLDWFEGNLYTSYPNRALQRKMLQVADELGAVIQGDDGEIYTSVEDFPESMDRQLAAEPSKERLPAYKRREIIEKVIVYGAIAAVIVAINVFELW